jgi:transposase
MSLLPKVPGLKLENTAMGVEVVEFTITSTSLPAACPVCGQKTARLHSHYGRTVADLPWSGRRVRLLLNVRKFRCSPMGCPRRIFTERLPDLVESYARKTVRLHEILELVGFALGGEAGARLVRRLGIAVSPSTLLRYVRGSPTNIHPPPTVIGVDDFSLRRGHTESGYILRDMEEKRNSEESESERLERLYRKAADPMLRTHLLMVLRVSLGDLVGEVAETVGYSKKWTTEIIRRYESGGVEALGDRRHGSPGARERALLDEAGEAELVEALQGVAPASLGGGMWSGPKVAGWIAQRNGLEEVHVQRGFEYLRKLGYSPQVPRPRNASVDASENEAFKNLCPSG